MAFCDFMYCIINLLFLSTNELDFGGRFSGKDVDNSANQPHVQRAMALASSVFLKTNKYIKMASENCYKFET